MGYPWQHQSHLSQTSLAFGDFSTVWQGRNLTECLKWCLFGSKLFWTNQLKELFMTTIGHLLLESHRPTAYPTGWATTRCNGNLFFACLGPCYGRIRHGWQNLCRTNYQKLLGETATQQSWGGTTTIQRPKKVVPGRLKFTVLSRKFGAFHGNLRPFHGNSR